MPPIRLVGEAADAPSPRTAWSAYNRKEIATWQSCHEMMLADANAYVRSSIPATRLVLFGDSITEAWRTTSYCKPAARARGASDVLNTTIGAHWPSPLPLGIAADCTQHLLYRMKQGELSTAMATDPQVIFVLLIGTNNLGRGHNVGETLRGILACARYLLSATRGKLLINARLPRCSLTLITAHYRSLPLIR